MTTAACWSGSCHLAPISPVGPTRPAPSPQRRRRLFLAFDRRPSHPRRHRREEITFPGPSIDRANRSRWLEEGGTTLRERASREVERLEGEMFAAASDLEFERAAELRDRIAWLRSREVDLPG